MVQRDLIPEEVNDIEQWKLIREAVSAAGPTYGETPYGATKTAELDIQFSIDPSFGLSRERYAWFSDQVLFDRTNFDTSEDRIRIATSDTDGTSSARIRSAYPGQYVSHTLAEPGLGAEIPDKHINRDSDDYVSLTHGEISIEVSSIETSTGTGIDAHGISYESDATYHQVRSDGVDVAKVPQQDWNIDPMDGTGPSGEVLRPEDGYVYQFIYTWYGEGAMILAVQNPETSNILPVNAYVPNDPTKPPVTSPNLPVQVIIQNQGTADSLGAVIGGMQYATHGSADERTTTRGTEEARHGASISDTVVLSEESVDPYATTLSPLIAATRRSDREVQKGLRFELGSVLLDADSACYLFVFDEFDTADAGLDGSFTKPVSRNGNTEESKILTNTTATTYNPTSSTSVLRGITYVPSSKNSPSVVTESDTSARIPLRSTVVIAAALAPGGNNTTADPIKATFREGF